MGLVKLGRFSGAGGGSGVVSGQTGKRCGGGCKRQMGNLRGEGLD